MSFFNCCTVEDLNSGKIGAQGDSNVKGQAMEIERVLNPPAEFQNLSQKEKMTHLVKYSPNWSFAATSTVPKFLELKAKLMEAVGKDKELDVFAKKPVLHFSLKPNGMYLGQCVEKDAGRKIYERQGVGHHFDGYGAYYVGCWERDFPNRVGLLVEVTGDYFLGEFLNGKKVYGVHYSSKERRTYQGPFDENQAPFGAGEIHYDDGRYYQGIVWKGVPNGFGYYSWPNGNYYEGRFSDGVQHGSGDLFLAATPETTSDHSDFLQEGKNGKSGKLFKNTEWELGVLKQEELN